MPARAAAKTERVGSRADARSRDAAREGADRTPLFGSSYQALLRGIQLQRAPLAGAPSLRGTVGGRAPYERRGSGNQARLRALSAELKVGAPDSAAEREADDTARRVAVGAPCHCGGRCEKCRAAASAPPLLRRFASQAGESGSVGVAPPEVHSALAERGRPLDRTTRQAMESSFGHDFSRVRVHTGDRAARSAESVSALAYTVGHHVVFGRGRYAPATSAGRHLLAHELAHVMQQAGARVLRRLPIPHRPDPFSPPARPSAPPSPPPASTSTSSTVLPTTGCSADEAGKVTRALREARTMLDTTRSALSPLARRAGRSLLPRSGLATTSPAAAALARTFKTSDPRVAEHIELRLLEALLTVESLLAGGASLALACHSIAADPECASATAYLPAVAPGATRRSGMVFCPTFFNNPMLSTDQARGAVAIHEIMHALVGGEHIDDRAYSHFRYFPDLTTEEALTNADSYRIFVLHVVTGTAPTVGHIFMDLVEDCDADQSAKLDRGLRRIQQWLMVAQRVTHDRRPAWLALPYWQNLRTRYLGGLQIALITAADTAYRGVLGSLGMFVQARCHSAADAVCPAGTPTASAAGTLGDEVQLCPDWFVETRPDERALLLLVRLLAIAGIAAASAQRAHAELARELFDDLGEAPDLRTILGLPPLGDFPERTLPPGVERA